MSQQKIYRAIIDLNFTCKSKTKKEILEEIKAIAVDAEIELNKISEANRKSYTADIELSRLKRKRNNSRQAIRKKWSSRKDYKEMILKHIKILKELKGIL